MTNGSLQANGAVQARVAKALARALLAKAEERVLAKGSRRRCQVTCMCH